MAELTFREITQIMKPMPILNDFRAVKKIMEEAWLPIAGLGSSYEVSNCGRVRSKRRCGTPGKILKPNYARRYYCVCLSVNNRKYSKPIHRLVAETFIMQPAGACLEVNHKDGNRLNNSVSNLEWVTRSQNMQHALANGLFKSPKGEDHYRTKFRAQDISEIRFLGATGTSQSELAEQFKVGQSQISRILNGKRWKSTNQN